MYELVAGGPGWLVAKHVPVIVDPGHMVSRENRNLILSFEKALIGVEGAMFGDCWPLKHIFTPGIYAREITIPAEVVMTGKIHRERHLNFLVSGRVKVYTEHGGLEEMEGPLVMVSEPGTKRALHTLSEVVWTTIHHNPNNETDLEKLEEMVIAPTYELLEDMT